LRSVRRGLKSPPNDLDREAAEAVREAVKAAELAAEFRLLDGLEAQSPPAGDSGAPALERLVAVARGWGRSVPRAELERLVGLLPK
jgi:hypothetical protein